MRVRVDMVEDGKTEGQGVELWEQKRHRKEAEQSQEPGEKQGKNAAQGVAPRWLDFMGGKPSVVVDNKGIGLSGGVCRLAATTSVFLGAMSGRPVSALGTPVPGAAFKLLGLWLGCFRRN